MEIVREVAAFEENVRRARAVLDRISAFPRSIFQTPPASLAFLDYGHVTSRELFERLVDLCKVNDERGFVFMMTAPDPVNYFQKNFGWLPAASFSCEDQVSAFTEFVTRDPGGSPADAIAYRSDEIMAISDGAAVALYGRRDREIAVLGSFAKAVDFRSGKGPPSIFMDSLMAYEYLARSPGFSLRRDEFIASWAVVPAS